MADDIILQFDAVTLDAAPPYEHALDSVSFALKAGELAAVRVPGPHVRLPLADAAEGLAEPAAGRVLFLGEDWALLPPGPAAAARGRVGRVFEDHGWASNLDADENVTVAQRFHTARTDGEIEQEAGALARKMGFADLPRMRPALMRPSELRRLEWVRAFLGEPRLVILENPARGVAEERVPALIEAVAGARARGAAVLWIEGETGGWLRAAEGATLRLELKGAALVPVAGG